MSQPPSIPPQQPPLADLSDFRDWATFVKARRDAEEMPERRTIEAQKISSEFSKIIISNLQFINAGGLLAVPSLANNLLGLTGLSRDEKILYLGPPMALFGLGLILATMTAFFTYRNYEVISRHWDAERRWREADLSRLAPRLVQQPWDALKVEAQKDKKRYNFRTWMYFWLGLATGWLSVACFVGACIILAFDTR